MRTMQVTNSRRRIARAGRTVALAALSAASPVLAANLLVNPGFEAPVPTQGEDQTASGWTFTGTAMRAGFQNHTPGGSRMIWGRTFEPAGGGVFQNVGITAGAQYDLSSWLF